VSQSEQDLARLAQAGPGVCPTPGQAGPLMPTPNAAALLARLGMTLEQMVQMGKRRVGLMHTAGVRVVAGTDGGIAAAKPHGLLPVSVAFLVDGGVSTVAALASATALAAAACGLADSKGRLRAGYDADLLVVRAAIQPVAVAADGRPLAASFSVRPPDCWDHQGCDGAVEVACVNVPGDAGDCRAARLLPECCRPGDRRQARDGVCRWIFTLLAPAPVTLSMTCSLVRMRSAGPGSLTRPPNPFD
jgi:Amidohydrolase family